VKELEETCAEGRRRRVSGRVAPANAPQGAAAARAGPEKACKTRTATRKLAVGASDWVGRSAREREGELPGDSPVDASRRAGAEPVLNQESFDGVLGERDVEPAHRPAAARAGVEIGAKDVRQKPRPPIA